MEFENVDPNGLDYTEFAPVNLEKVAPDDDRPAGIKRVKLNHPILDNSMEQAACYGALAKDEHAVFADFIANEMRNMKNDTIRREVKRNLTKCLMEATEKDEAAATESNEWRERDIGSSMDSFLNMVRINI